MKTNKSGTELNVVGINIAVQRGDSCSYRAAWCSTCHTCCLCQTATQLVHIFPGLQPKINCAPTAPSQLTGIQQLASFHLLNAPAADSPPHFTDRHGKRTTAGTAGRGISGSATTTENIHSNRQPPFDV